MNGTTLTGLAIEKNDARFAVYVDGEILRTPKRNVVRWFKTQAAALRAGYAKRNE